MKKLVFPLLFLLSLSAFSQKIHDEFMPTFIGDKEAFLSTKTGEFVYREHAKTDVSAMYTSDSGTVIYEDRITHAVKKGETLSVIAKKHGVSIAELKSQNKLKSVNLSIGQELKIIKKQVVPSSKPVINKPEGKIIARLAPGQTPGGMTPPDLPPDAMPGSTINLVVEDDAKTTPTKPVVNEKAEDVVNNINEDGAINHVVKSGETLFSIARKHKVSIADLKKDNKLALNNVSPGQKLKIKVYNTAVFSQEGAANTPVPAKPVVEEKQEVVEITKNNIEQVEEVVEEKVKEVVEKKVEVEEEVEEKEAVVEEKIVVKEKTETVTSSEVEKSQPKTTTEEAREERTKALIEKYKKKEVAESEADKSSVYVVKKGDTLWSIAKRHHISLKDLKELNKLDTNVLSVGQELKLK